MTGARHQAWSERAIATSLQIRVKPNARDSRLQPPAASGDEGAIWQAWLKAPPVDGKANTELIALVAAHFGVPKRAVTIAAGAGARLKRVRVDRL